jgi:hypothetical protein
MTTCTPLKPFRCWRKDSTEPVPEWAQYYFDAWRGGPPNDWWIVEDIAERCRWYTPAEFAERFKLEGT